MGLGGSWGSAARASGAVVLAALSVTACSGSGGSTALTCKVSLGSKHETVAVQIPHGGVAPVAFHGYTITFSRAGSGLQAVVLGPSLGRTGATFRTDGTSMSTSSRTPPGYLKFACPP